MQVHDAAYRNTDEEYAEICEFLDRLSTQDPFMLWESGRMNYWRYNIHANKKPDYLFFRDNVHLWRTDTHELVGLCISEYGENDLFIEVLPAYQQIYPAIFDWIEGTWAATRVAIEIDVFNDDAQKIHRLEAQGFSFLAHFENKRIYDLEQVELGYTLEPGFTIQRFSASRDFAGRVALVRSAFGNTRYTEANIQGLMASPDYIDEYNLSVVAPDGQQVAYCIGWHDRSKAQAGYIEPVGTHAAFRRRGFAKAINRECFRRMKANGIKTVEIASRAEPDVANFLYNALGPASKREVHKYGKQVSSS
ncbi:MAG: GNAT family N-acetyltransferase [Caldilineaceae bacterium]